MAMDAIGPFHQQLREVGRQPKLDLWIHSHGGMTEMPWRLIQLLRCYCDELGVLVTATAQSAATHVALGANEIVMGPLSVLSPVDPSRRHPLGPKVADQSGEEKPFPVSVQDLKHAVEFLKREAGDGGLSGEAYARVVTALFDKVHPLAIGAIEQSYALSKLITRRMLTTHMDPTAEAEAIDRLVDGLCDDLKSHDFPIAVLEAEALGLKVVRADDALYDAMLELLAYYDGVDRSPRQLPQGAQIIGAFKGQPRVQTVGHIDSTAIRMNCEGLVDMVGGTFEKKGARWVTVGGAAAQAGPAQPIQAVANP
jgi:hypothetical protein